MKRFMKKDLNIIINKVLKDYKNSYKNIIRENKFLLTDGYHRVTEGLLKGETKFLAEIDWKGYSTEWKIPHKKDRFYLKNE